MLQSTTLFLIFISSIVAIALAAFQYFYKNNRSAKYLWTLFLLRTVGIFSILLLLINPEFITTDYYKEKPNLVLAVDNSSSIRNFGKVDEVKHFVAAIKNDPEIRENFNIRTYSFGKILSKTDSLKFSEPQTDIHGALKNLNELYKSSISPTILITDGNQTFGGDYKYEVQNYGNAILPVIVGDTTAHRDISITRVNVNQYTFLNNQFPVEMILNYVGSEAIQTELQISKGNSIVYSKQISFDQKENSQVIKAFLPASTLGAATYKAVLLALPGEKNIQNNLSNFAVEVIDERLSVIVVSSLTHPDLGTLKRSIETNPQREVIIANIKDNAPDLRKHGLIILYQPTREFEELIKTLKIGDLNYWIITGPETDWRYLNEIQDYFQKEISSQTEEYFPKLNKDFASFQLDDIGYSNFPPLVGLFGELKATEKAEILLYQQVQGVTLENPLMATVEDGSSRKAFLFGANLWKWRSQAYTEQGTFENFDSFIGKLVQFLASGEKKERISLTYENLYFGNQNILLSAQYFDENYNFDPRGNLKLELINKNNEEKRLIPLSLVGNRYQVKLSQIPSSEYSFRVIAEGENLSKSGNFTVVDFEVENQFTNANLAGLQEIADSKNERLFFLDDSEKLKETLLSNINLRTVQKSRQNRVSLIDWYYLLAITVLSFSSEWFLRKYHGLI